MPEKTSIWKKEIRLRRPRPAVVEEHAHERTLSELRIEWPTPRRSEVWPAVEPTVAQGEPPTALATHPAARTEMTVAEVNAAVVEVREKLAERLDGALAPASPAAAEPEPEPPPPPAAGAPELLPVSSLAQPQVARPEPPAPKQPKQPLLRRELHLPRPRLPGRGGAARGQKIGVATLVGLRVGSSQLAAALVHNNGSAELLRLARTPLPRGIVTAGEVRDIESLARALKSFFAEHKLPRRGIRLGVATNRIGVRVVEVPALDDPKQLANAIRFRAQEVLPIPIGEAVLDYVVLGDSRGERGSTQRRVLVVFAHRELVDGYIDACKRAGLKLAGIDLDAFALLRALSDETDSRETPAAVVAVAIGRERTIFAVSDGSVCDFARVLDWGGASLDAALAGVLEITLEEAEHVKETMNVSADRLDAARGALRHELEALARELVSSLQFYQSRSGSLDIGEVLLTGGGAQLAGIAEELCRLLGVPVRIGDPFGRVTLGDKVTRPADAGSLAIAVGLGIES